MKFDLTQAGGMVVTAGGAHTLKVQASHNASVAQALTAQVQSSTSDPFTESSLTWSNQADKTIVSTQSVNVAPGACCSTYTMALSDADVSQLAGKWVQVKLTGAQRSFSLNPAADTWVDQDNPNATTAPRRP
jgi:hypothetical protein